VRELNVSETDETLVTPETEDVEVPAEEPGDDAAGEPAEEDSAQLEDDVEPPTAE
jgi:hypothetical protein